MITANVIHRVFCISDGVSSMGTAFAIDIGSREYFITAAHVLPNYQQQSSIGIFANGGWLSVPARLVGLAPAPIDIAVLELSQRLVPPSLPMPAGYADLVYGQDAYFLGFPFGMTGAFSFGPEGFPMPFVKRATISLFDRDRLYLDGINNNGFSGGPVVYKTQGSLEFKVAAVVSAYHGVHQNVLHNAAPTGLVVQENSGLIIASPIDAAVALAKADAGI